MLEFVPLACLTFMFVATIARGRAVKQQSGVSSWAFIQAKGWQRVLGAGFALSGLAVAASAVFVAADGGAALAFASGLTLAGMLITSVAQVQMGKAWRVGVREGDAPLFVEIGLFRYSRNPIFVGMILVASGTALAANIWLSWVAATAFAVVCALQVQFEERHLRNSFGTHYEAYYRRVPRWIGLPG